MNTVAGRHVFGAVTPDSLKARYFVAKNAWLDRAYSRRFGQHTTPLPEEVKSYLRADNPKLIDLQHRYSKANAFTPMLTENIFLRTRSLMSRPARPEGSLHAVSAVMEPADYSYPVLDCDDCLSLLLSVA